MKPLHLFLLRKRVGATRLTRSVCHVLSLLALGLLLLSMGLPVKAEERQPGTLVVGIATAVRTPSGRGLSGFDYGSLEYRITLPCERLSVAGSFEFSGGDRYVNVGLFFKILETDRFIVGIGSGPGFMKNGRFTLGNRLEFRSVAELQVKLGKRYRLGLDYCHYSNGGTGSINPGAESIRLFLAIKT
jgi:hypothetical protein